MSDKEMLDWVALYAAEINTLETSASAGDAICIELVFEGDDEEFVVTKIAGTHQEALRLCIREAMKEAPLP